MGSPDVTVVCATYNARDAVRLTFASYFRHNPFGAPVFVADNGSTDGALEELRRWPGLHVVTLPQRMALLEHERARDAAARRRAAGSRPTPGTPAPQGLDPLAVGEHGATLDWLVDRVTTRYVLVMDSDVEFLGPGCVEAMVEDAERQGLDAYGVLEPGWPGYRPRLAPYLLLLRTDTVRRLGVSFQGTVVFDDEQDRVRWEQRRPSYEATPAELALYPSIAVYSTAAKVFEALENNGARHADLPPGIRRRFRHIGHMSWAGLTDDSGGSESSREVAARRGRVVREALRAYPS